MGTKMHNEKIRRLIEDAFIAGSAWRGNYKDHPVQGLCHNAAIKYATDQDIKLVPSVPKFKFDTLVQHCKYLDDAIAQARSEVHQVTLYQQDAVWFWQHDGRDHLESLTCPIIIQPSQLRELLKGVGTIDAVKLRDAIAQAIGGDAYDCTRVWSAWSAGTMTDEDFEPLVDQEDRLNEIVDAVISVIK